MSVLSRVAHLIIAFREIINGSGLHTQKRPLRSLLMREKPHFVVSLACLTRTRHGEEAGREHAHKCQQHPSRQSYHEYSREIIYDDAVYGAVVTSFSVLCFSGDEQNEKNKTKFMAKASKLFFDDKSGEEGR